MDKINLKILADHLAATPADYQHFDMGLYFDGDEKSYVRSGEGVTECDTVACALGHGPAAGLPFPKDIAFFDWIAYGEAVFGFEPASLAWSYVFYAAWQFYDDTAHGAAARIYYLLENGAPPPGFKRPSRKFVRTLT